MDGRPQVKECVAAAKRGETWSKAPAPVDEGDTSPVDKTVRFGRPRARLGPASFGRSLTASVRGVHVVVTMRAQVTERTDDTRKLHEQKGEEGATQQQAAPKQQHKGLASSLVALGTGQAVALWAVVLLVLLAVGPRVLRRLRRRQRSGMRTE